MYESNHDNSSLCKRYHQKGHTNSYNLDDEEAVHLLNERDIDEELIEIETPSVSNSRHQDVDISCKPAKFRFLFILICILFFSFLYIPLFHTVTKRRSVALPGWWTNISRNVENYVFPNKNTTIIDPNYVCDSRNNEKLFILIVVCSATKHFDARESIRETWGNTTVFNYDQFETLHQNLKGNYLEPNSKTWEEYILTEDIPDASIINEMNGLSFNRSKSTVPISKQKLAIKLIFLLGQTEKAFLADEEYEDQIQNQINAEAESYGDILQEGFLDTYNNLTLKSIMLLKWVTNNCDDKVKYVLKVDDDTFINLPNLIHVLLGGTVPLYNASVSFHDRDSVLVKAKKNRLVDTKNLLLGHLFCGVKPVSDVSSKWYSPYYLYEKDVYPAYLSGTAYLMSINTVHELYNASLHTAFFHLEDVYVTGICANKIRIKRTHHSLFFYSSIKDKDKLYCSLRGMISHHHLTSGEMKQAYEMITNNSIKCSVPYKKMLMPKLKLQVKPKC